MEISLRQMLHDAKKCARKEVNIGQFRTVSLLTIFTTVFTIKRSSADFMDMMSTVDTACRLQEFFQQLITTCLRKRLSHLS